MNPERWLCSKFKLCELTTAANSGLTNIQDPAEMMINTQSYLEPHYDPSSIFLTLEAYCDALAELGGQRSEVTMTCRDHMVQGPGPVQTNVLHHFVEKLAEKLLGAALTQTCSQSTDNPMVTHPDQIHHICNPSKVGISNQERLAVQLAFEIYSKAMEEVASHGSFADRMAKEQLDVQPKQMNHSSMYPYEEGEGHEIEVDTKTKEHDSTQIHDGAFHDTCSTVPTTTPNTIDIMAQLGSLDYPDAPPSTPLLPELIKSRASFTRKLKGGLAKEFLPSPPPPTPKDQQAASDKSEFMVRLMHSLSLACSQHAYLNEEENEEKARGRFQSEISNYAAQISADIIHCITAAQSITSTNREAPVRGVRFLANHLAEEIVISSIAEVMGSGKEDGKTHLDKDISSCVETKRECATKDIPSVETLRSMAGRLITNTLIQSFSDLRKEASQPATSKPFTDIAESTPGQRENQYSSSSPNYYQTTTAGFCNEKFVILDPTKTPSTAEQSFADDIVHEVLDSFIIEASKSFRCIQTTIKSERLSSSVLSQQTSLRGIIPDTLCHDIVELQCALLWTAASCMGISVLQIDLPYKYIQHQLHSLSLQAQIYGWTVADLMVSILQHVKDRQAASRGHSKISTSLLGHLLCHKTTS